MRAWIAVLFLLVPLVAEAQPEPTAEDPFANVRRLDGTLDWSRLNGAQVPQDAVLKSFSLEYFVKELAAVARTGDRQRIQEFFTGVTATDFYTNYGVFVVTATAAEIGYDLAYKRYLHRYLEPRFVSGLMRSNIALATGLGLAQLVNGEFDGKVFMVSFASLGISSAAVNAVASKVPTLRRLRAASHTAGAARWFKLGGFVYQTAELAVIFFGGRLIEEQYYAYKDRAQARSALAGVARRTWVQLADPACTPEDAEAALERYVEAWDHYRNFLYTPLLQERAKFLETVAKLARRAKIEATTLDAMRARAADYDGLPLLKLAERMEDERDAELTAQINREIALYTESFEELFAEVYLEHRRKGSLLSVDPHQLALRAQASYFTSAHRRASRNRLQTYADQRSGLTALRGFGHDELVDAQLARLTRLAVADQHLLASDLGTEIHAQAQADSTNVVEATRAAGDNQGLIQLGR